MMKRIEKPKHSQVVLLFERKTYPRNHKRNPIFIMVDYDIGTENVEKRILLCTQSIK